MMMIASNALWIWIDSDWNDEPVLLDAQVFPFQIVEHIFCFYFWCELWIRFLAFKVKVKCLMDGWFVFDSLLLLTMVIETWVMTLFVAFSRLNDDGAGGSAGGLNNVSIMRMARLLRLTRMARLVRLLRHCPEVMIIIKGLLAASWTFGSSFAKSLTRSYTPAMVTKERMQKRQRRKKTRLTTVLVHQACRLVNVLIKPVAQPLRLRLALFLLQIIAQRTVMLNPLPDRP